MSAPETHKIVDPNGHFGRPERLEVAGLMAGQIAHDFNNLLTPLLTYPELIRHEINQNPVVNEYLAIIEKTATEMQFLTQKLLTLARRGRVGKEVLNVNDVIVQVTKFFQGILPQGITIKSELAEDLPSIIGNSAQLFSALQNLYQNAFDALGASGTLLVKTEGLHSDRPIGDEGEVPIGDYVKISLIDTGAGIEAAVLDKIFDPFFTTKRAAKQRGSGLGLSVAHGIFKDHQGYIGFTSKVGQGTAFCVYLPVMRELPPEVITKNGAKEPVPLSVKLNDLPPLGKQRAPRILIADDEQMIRKLFGLIIASEFREALIDQAANGKEAVSAFSVGYHDLIIMDLQMPGQDGRESFFEIQKICLKKQWHMPPIIFCTGFTPSEALAEIIKDSSIHCLLRKPIKAEALLDVIRLRLKK